MLRPFPWNAAKAARYFLMSPASSLNPEFSALAPAPIVASVGIPPIPWHLRCGSPVSAAGSGPRRNQMSATHLSTADAQTWYQAGDRPIFLADVVDASHRQSSMSVGFARYARGASNA